jgi:hypothetical protein
MQNNILHWRLSIPGTCSVQFFFNCERAKNEGCIFPELRRRCVKKINLSKWAQIFFAISSSYKTVVAGLKPSTLR